LFAGSIGNANSVERELGDLDDNDDKMKHSKDASDATSQKENFSLKCFGVHIEYVDGDHVSSRLFQPTAGC
jgi:hypothetical protein